jgi:hypothetical protein
MSTTIPNRRLSPRIISQDVDSFNGLGLILTYSTNRPEAMPATLQDALHNMQARQQTETEKQLVYKMAAEAARQAEWEFHNAVLAMKEAVRGQFGSDSNEAQAVGLKKKSNRKRPTRSNSTAPLAD